MSLLEPLDIVNAACAMIGETPLQSLDEETDAGQSAGLLYDNTVTFNLGVYVFSFSKQARQCSRDDSTVPLTGYAYVYDIPAEAIGNPLYCTDDITDPDRRFTAYVIVGSKIHTDAETLFAMIRFLPNVRNWSATFRSATITSMAAALAISLTHDRALADAKLKEAYGTPDQNYRGGQLGAAIRDDAFTNPPRKQDRDSNPLTAAWNS
jgi:hypothetical protein